jgi:hypothetical protein
VIEKFKIKTERGHAKEAAVGAVLGVPEKGRQSTEMMHRRGLQQGGA